MEQAAEIFEALSRGEVWNGEFLVRRKGGAAFHAMVGAEKWCLGTPLVHPRATSRMGPLSEQGSSWCAARAGKAFHAMVGAEKCSNPGQGAGGHTGWLRLGEPSPWVVASAGLQSSSLSSAVRYHFGVQVTDTPILDKERKLIGIIGVSADIGELKRKEQEIRALNEQLERRVVERTEQLEQSNEALRVEIEGHLRAQRHLQVSCGASRSGFWAQGLRVEALGSVVLGCGSRV